jgi:tetratricopeptide (TPR) repeat protein
VIALADATLSVVDDLEESYYWRGLARQALGDADGAIADFKAAHEFNANFGAAAEALTLLGVAH